MDGCSSNCTIEIGYECILDENYTSVCSSTCGDNVFANGTEDCDDGNLLNSDGCSSNCSIEVGFECQL